MIRVGTSKEAQGGDKKEGEAVGRGYINVFAVRIRGAGGVSAKVLPVSPSAILKELAVTLAFLHKSQDNPSLFGSINGRDREYSKVTRACKGQLCAFECGTYIKKSLLEI